MVERSIGAHVGQSGALAGRQALHCAHLALGEDGGPKALLLFQDSHLPQGCHHITVMSVTEDPVWRHHLLLLVCISPFTEAEDQPDSIAGHDVELQNLSLPESLGLLAILHIVIGLDAGTHLDDGGRIHTPLFPCHSLTPLLKDLLETTHVPNEAFELLQGDLLIVVQIHDHGLLRPPTYVCTHQFEFLGVQLLRIVMVKTPEGIANLREFIFQAV
mmetsp:Transcript_17885/g.39432  ORF Transcript_17885/g.39432 Transcript_17885/m.39432 type:complete len:216 (+) Transcript_17885:3308-3955(+)